MDLRQRLAVTAVIRTSLLVVEVPGWARTRWAVEREVRRRGWRVAMSPADADVLLTCGVPGPRLAGALDLVWAQLPGPRVRLDVLDPSAVGAALQHAAVVLLDDDQQRRDAADRPGDPVMGSLAEDEDEDEDADMDMDMDDGDMGMGDMGMAPGGIPLASGGGDDRDQLDLDALHLPLGPVLPCWPAGLLVHCTLHGDVVAEAHAEVLGAAAGATPEVTSFGTPSDRLDRAAQLLLLAGWGAAATTTARIRDDLLATDDPSSCTAALDRLTGRIRRSRTLRWSLRGLGQLDPNLARAHHLGGGMGGDVWDRLLGFLADARSGLDGHLPVASPTPVGLLPELMTGLELSAVRLVVASLDLEPAAQRPRAVAPG